MFMSLQLDGSQQGLVPSLMVVPNTNKPITALLSNHTITVNSMSTSRLVTFPAVHILGAMAPFAYFALYGSGVSTILNEGGLKALTLPVTMHSVSVSTLSASGRCPGQLDENERASIDIKLTNSNTQSSVSGKIVYAIVQPSRSLRDPKRLINAVSGQTNMKGVGTFSEFYFTTKGTVGSYKVHFVVDTKEVMACEIYVSSIINATASSVVVEERPWMNFSDAVVIGKVVPKAVRVHLVAKNVSHTVVGKMAVLVATNPT